ncbi:CBS domain-containing protein [Streptomyces lonarensis]|uniref:CBS domain-containing protein n=1 Tax=Streptomyces lonarensis TaxID=700599 RepID=A0A7X6D6K1_9ACTN|nr:CBS domain-containing protein [Streptomyces lonarensis]NJQ08858.1 CBS domain-containing protein [Streptomyces lonarensis]
MRHTKVGHVMATDVVTAVRETPYGELSRLLCVHRVGGLPVIDDEDRVIGVVSRGDLARRGPGPAGAGQPTPGQVVPGAVGLPGPAAATRGTAGELMATPPETVRAQARVVEAARLMARRRLGRLPVVDEEDRLVGIVTRRDLLRVFHRPDEEIRRAVTRDVVVDTLWLAPESVRVTVVDGVVTLEGATERLSEKEIAVRVTARVDGVVGVVDRLTYRIDDSRAEPPWPGGAEGAVPAPRQPAED